MLSIICLLMFFAAGVLLAFAFDDMLEFWRRTALGIAIILIAAATTGGLHL